MLQKITHRKKAQIIFIALISNLLLVQTPQVANAQNRSTPVWRPIKISALPLPSSQSSDLPPDCKTAKWGEPCTIRINRAKLTAPGTVLVASGTQVTIVVYNKSPFESAKFNSNRVEVPPPPGVADVLKDLIGGLLIPNVSRLTLASRALTESSESIAQNKAKPETVARFQSGSEEYQVIGLLNAIASDKSGNQAKIKAVFDRYDGLNKQISDFFDGSSDYCTQGIDSPEPVTFFKTQLATISTKIEALKSESLVSLEGDEANFAIAKKLLEKVVTRAPFDTEFAVESASMVNQVSGLLQLYKEAITNLNEARKGFIQLGGTLKTFDGAKCTQKIAVVADRQANITGNVVFTNQLTNKESPQQLYTKVAFRDLPRASLSVGVLISTLEKRTFNAASVFDGAGATSTDPVKVRLEIRGEASRPQVIPFSFANIRLTQWRVRDGFYTFNLTPGIGVNPNGGTNEVEFALGASLGINNVYLFGGFHFGREANLINGFSIGDRVPNSFVPPVGRDWKTNFGFGVSYRVPLP